MGSLTDILEESSDDGGFLAPLPIRFYPRGRRRFNIILLPGSAVSSSSHQRSDPWSKMVPTPFPSSLSPRSPSISRSSVLSPVDIDLRSVTRLPVLLQVHQHPEYTWNSTTRGRTYDPSDPTPPPWEVERIRDTLARDLDYLEKQVPPFLQHPAARPQVHSPRHANEIERFSATLDGHSSSQGYLSGSKPSGSRSSLDRSGKIPFRSIPLPEAPMALRTFSPNHPSLPTRTYENWPRRDFFTSPIFIPAPTRSPYTFEQYIDEMAPAPTVPVSEPSPGNRTLLDMSVDDPYEFDPVIPDTSPEITTQVPGPMTTTTSTSSLSSSSRFRRTRDRYENMEARVAAMKEEFFEYRRREKKRMESVC